MGSLASVHTDDGPIHSPESTLSPVGDSIMGTEHEIRLHVKGYRPNPPSTQLAGLLACSARPVACPEWRVSSSQRNSRDLTCHACGGSPSSQPAKGEVVCTRQFRDLIGQVPFRRQARQNPSHPDESTGSKSHPCTHISNIGSYLHLIRAVSASAYCSQPTVVKYCRGSHRLTWRCLSHSANPSRHNELANTSYPGWIEEGRDDVWDIHDAPIGVDSPDSSRMWMGCESTKPQLSP